MKCTRFLKMVLVSTVCLASSVTAKDGTGTRPAVSVQDYFPEVRTVHIEKHVFKNDLGESVEGEKGFVAVPEVRGVPNTRNIKVAFIRIRATTDDPAPPVVLLHGGPTSKGIIETRSTRIHVLTEMQSFADQILIDGRGLGLSEPSLICHVKQPELIIRKEAQHRMYAREGSECKAYWEQQGADLRGYNPVAYADDVADLMVSLGYKKFSLTGNSFGAYWSIAVAKRHPDLVHRMAISGVYGLDRSWGLPNEAEDAFSDQVKHLDATEAVKSMFREQGISGALSDLMRRLEKEPVSVEVDFLGRKETLTFDPATVARIIYSGGMTQHRKGASMLPLFLYALDKGAYEGIAKLTIARVEKEFQPKPMPLNISAISTLCNFATSKEFNDALISSKNREVAPHYWIGQNVIARHNVFACDEIGFPAVDAEWVAPFTSAIPVFAMSGSFDGNTTPAGAKRSLESFPNTHWIIVNGGGHRHREIEQAVPEVAKLKREFLAGKDFDVAIVEIDAPPLDVKPFPWYGRVLFSIGLGNTVLKRMAP